MWLQCTHDAFYERSVSRKGSTVSRWDCEITGQPRQFVMYFNRITVKQKSFAHPDSSQTINMYEKEKLLKTELVVPNVVPHILKKFCFIV